MHSPSPSDPTPGLIKPAAAAAAPVWVPIVGPATTELARTRAEMKALETVVQLRRERPRRMRHRIPAHVWPLVKSYRLEPTKEETP